MQFAVQENGYTGHAGRRFIYPIRNNRSDPRNQRLYILLEANAEKVRFSPRTIPALPRSSRSSFPMACSIALPALRVSAFQIGFDTTGGKPRAVNVTVKEGLRSRTFTARKEIIVTSGFYNTPAVLLKSGVGPEGELREMQVLIPDSKIDTG